MPSRPSASASASASSNLNTPNDWDNYEDEFIPGPAYEHQEEALSEVFASFQPDPASVLEVGPGLGRITKLATGMWPQAEFCLFDLSKAAIEKTSLALPDVDFVSVTGNIAIAGALALPSLPKRFDLVIAVEVLLHIHPSLVSTAVSNLLTATRVGCYLVTCDWTERLAPPNQPERPIRVGNYRHDYPSLFHAAGASIIESRRTGLQTIYLVQL
jgi:hypothetical protein